MRLRQITPLIATALGLAWAPENAGADSCPESCVYSYCSTLARRDTSFSDWEYGSSRASYDLPGGRVYADGNSGRDNVFGSNALARDRFTVFGPASPGPIAFTARVHVAGYASAVNYQFTQGSIAGSLREGSNPAIGASASTSSEGASLDQVLALSLQLPVGESFELTYTASASGSGHSLSARVSALLWFAGLPPGYGVVSCQGYSSGPVVATAPTSWGNVKLRYR